MQAVADSANSCLQMRKAVESSAISNQLFTMVRIVAEQKAFVRTYCMRVVNAYGPCIKPVEAVDVDCQLAPPPPHLATKLLTALRFNT